MPNYTHPTDPSFPNTVPIAVHQTVSYYMSNVNTQS